MLINVGVVNIESNFIKYLNNFIKKKFKERLLLGILNT